MTLSELIKKIGDENVSFQILNQNITNISERKRDMTCRVTFETNKLSPGDIVLGEGNIGLVVWIPQDKWKKALKDLE